MNGAAAVTAVVLLVFFLIGVGAGILSVMALSARRADKAMRWTRGRTPETDWPYIDDGSPVEEADEHPWWQAREGE